MQNIVYTYESLGSKPVIAIQDALSMLHTGSVSKSEHILLEARKKYVLAVNSLRLGVTGEKLDMPISQAMILATITVMSEVRSFLIFLACKPDYPHWHHPISTGMSYTALIHSHAGVLRDILRLTANNLAETSRWHVRACPHLSE